ncbi:translation initiation factor IF-2-like [Cygnus olor]|uniref:translation initiation factor IF-2-like n=1 Tax=Cygnus olor TaxID=8869 RepID=UPI001ADE5ED7|nr:translation initiation factor IF-2-like [Cygnus olor]
MDSYLLTSTRTVPPRPLHPLPPARRPRLSPGTRGRAALRPEEGPRCAPRTPSDTSWPWGLSPCPHPPPLLLLPGERLEAGEPGAAPLRGYLDPKRNGAFIPRREVCEPFPLCSPLGASGRGRIPTRRLQRGGLEACSSRPVSGLAGGGAGKLCLVPASLRPAEGKRSPAPLSPAQLGRGAACWGGSRAGVAPFPCPDFPSGIAASAHVSRSSAALASRRQRGPAWSRPLPQSLPCFRGSGGGRAGRHPQPAGLQAGTGVLGTRPGGFRAWRGCAELCAAASRSGSSPQPRTGPSGTGCSLEEPKGVGAS